MNTKPVLSVLICGGDGPALERIAQKLAAEGVQVETTTRVIDYLCFSHRKWDFLLVDLDGLTSFLRSLLPAVCRQFPNLPIIGISSRSATDINFLDLGYGLQLDDCLFDIPRPEDLIVRVPQIAANYLCDTGVLRDLGTSPLPA